MKPTPKDAEIARLQRHVNELEIHAEELCTAIDLYFMDDQTPHDARAFKIAVRRGEMIEAIHHRRQERNTP